MIDIERFILELEMHLERQDLLKTGLSLAEVEANFEFDYDFNSWYSYSQDPEGND